MDHCHTTATGTNSMSGTYYTGTSNIVVPGKKLDFPPEYRLGSRLHYYASLFNSLEVNSSFYKIPMTATFEKWAMDTPVDFRFTVKLWRGITHTRGLVYDPADVQRFLSAADGLGEKKGCLLVQFPASITYDYFPQVKNLLQDLHTHDPGKTWRKAVEFRHSSWYNPATISLLKEYHDALVWHDMPASASMGIDTGSGFILQRFHGEQGDYKGSYHHTLLQTRATALRAMLELGNDVYTYFNNTIGDAFENARMLRDYVGSPHG